MQLSNKLEEILDNLTGHLKPENFEKEAHQQILALIESICNEVVGAAEDEEVAAIPGVNKTDRIAHWRNQLRNEQRARLKDILKGTK